MRKTLFALPLLFVAACSSSEPAPGAEDPLGDPEVMVDELNGRPSYTVRSVAIRGEYRSAPDDHCPGGFDACNEIKVHYVDGKLKLEFGDWDQDFDLWSQGGTAFSQRGVVLFDTGEMHNECDDPGCGNLVRIHGVIYPVKVGNEWVPRIKTTVEADFPYPEYEGDNEGIVKTTVRLTKI